MNIKSNQYLDILHKLLCEYGYQSKLKKLYCQEGMNFDNIYNFFDFYNIQYYTSNELISTPCILEHNNNYYVLLSNDKIYDCQTKKYRPVIEFKPNGIFIYLKKITDNHLKLFDRFVFFKERLKLLTDYKLNEFIFFVLIILMFILSWIIAIFCENLIDISLSNGMIENAMSTIIYIGVCAIVFKILYTESIKISYYYVKELSKSNLNNTMSTLEYYHLLFFILIYTTLSIYIFISFNKTLAVQFIIFVLIETLSIYMEKIAHTLDNSLIYIFIHRIVTYLDIFLCLLYICLCLLMWSYESISLGIAALLFIFLFFEIILFHSYKIHYSNYKDIILSQNNKIISHLLFKTEHKNISSINNVIIHKYKNIHSYIISPKTACLIHGKSNSGKTYLSDILTKNIRDENSEIFLDKYNINTLSKEIIQQHIVKLDNQLNINQLYKLYQNSLNKNDCLQISDMMGYTNKNLFTISYKTFEKFQKEVNYMNDTEKFILKYLLYILDNKKIFIIDNVLDRFNHEIIQKTIEVCKHFNLIIIALEQTNINNNLYDTTIELK